MSRKDTIVVAVLINAGLLIVLFASALKSGGSSQELAVSAQPVSPQTAEVTLQKESAPSRGDEIDQVLSQFSQPAPVAVLPESAPIAVAVAQPVGVVAPSPSNFAEDLQAIGIPQVRASASASSPQSSVVAPQTEYVEIRVKKGDVLEKIARQYQTSVSEVVKYNKLATTNLRIGQVLKIPKKTASSATVAHTASSSGEGTKLYTIKNGDNPWTIAVKHHMKVDELLKLNGLNEEKARRLKPGDQIQVR